MRTKFFTNGQGNTLYEKFKGIGKDMKGFELFHAVCGFFRWSGYLRLREALPPDVKIKILAGIDVDALHARRSRALLFLLNDASIREAKEMYMGECAGDIGAAEPDSWTDQSVLQVMKDARDKRLEMRIHAGRNLHAKFYLCLPAEHTPDSDGWVIMGSSNISESGLGTSRPPRYELNVAMKDYDDVKFCADEFERLWEEGQPLTEADIEAILRRTHLGCRPTPYELYMKMLIEHFGDQVEEDFSPQLPPGIMDLKYQRDAAVQGYRMMMKHHGAVLADVVGLGKTLIAAMIARRFVEAVGRKAARILVVHPPALLANWAGTFKKFGLSSCAHFISIGSLNKILDGKSRYLGRDGYHLVIVDEAHRFRNDDSGMFVSLQNICKAPCPETGRLKLARKKVLLLTATPLNNRPEDVLNQLLLFQDGHRCTLDGVPDLYRAFEPWIQRYKKLMQQRGTRDIAKESDAIFGEMRTQVIDKITIRRTRRNVQNDEDYSKDLEKQGIRFPAVGKPEILTYGMSGRTSGLFYRTLALLTDDETGGGLHYARYRAIEFLKPGPKKKFKRADEVSRRLSGIYRTLMVKRLESSFLAFRKSLEALSGATARMIAMFEADEVVIAPDLKVEERLKQGGGIEDIFELARKKGRDKKDILFRAGDFEPGFIGLLREDRETLEKLLREWEEEREDPKFESFLRSLEPRMLRRAGNPSGKLVVFSESVDTLDFLEEQLKKRLRRADILKVTSRSVRVLSKTIRENFDANFPAAPGRDRYNILLASDVLSEGVNLHRASVIVNYDLPWNATRLMQRIGRVNRIGSKAEEIRNFVFYPSRQGNEQIRLYQNALAKLQGFHSAYGEDAQIFSSEEVVKLFEMYDPDVRDSVDRSLALLREVRKLHREDRELYDKIKALPLKSRALRAVSREAADGDTIAFMTSDVKTEFYRIRRGGRAEPLSFLAAADILRAAPEEKPLGADFPEEHYKHLRAALDRYREDYTRDADSSSVPKVPSTGGGRAEQTALKRLRGVQRALGNEADVRGQCELLENCVRQGVYARLPREIIRAFPPDVKNRPEQQIRDALAGLTDKYGSTKRAAEEKRADAEPRVVISETFIHTGHVHE